MPWGCRREGWGWRRRDGGWGWSRIKEEKERMEHVEHSTTIGNNVMNEDVIEDF